MLFTLDIDECANRSTIDCTQQCINTPGSYECDCYDGYQEINTNDTQCEGTYKQLSCACEYMVINIMCCYRYQ